MEEIEAKCPESAIANQGFGKGPQKRSKQLSPEERELAGERERCICKVRNSCSPASKSPLVAARNQPAGSRVGASDGLILGFMQPYNVVTLEDTRCAKYWRSTRRRTRLRPSLATLPLSSNLRIQELRNSRSRVGFSNRPFSFQLENIDAAATADFHLAHKSGEFESRSCLLPNRVQGKAPFGKVLLWIETTWLASTPAAGARP